MTYFVKYDIATGACTGVGAIAADQVALQASDGEGIVASETPLSSPQVINGMAVIAPDMGAIRTALHAQVDASAGAVRALFITDVPGQAQTYEKKEDEARRYTTGADPSQFPFLNAEAAVRGVTINQVQAEVLAQVAMLTPMAALIEAHRINAKNIISAAETIGAAAGASRVDWNAILAL